MEGGDSCGKREAFGITSFLPHDKKKFDKFVNFSLNNGKGDEVDD